MKVRRTGRGTPLKRAERRAVWKVLSAYRAKLDAGGYMDPADLIREARLLLQNAPGALPYRAVVADEVQDFRQADLALLRALVPQGDNDIFVVGDAHQRIYGHRAVPDAKEHTHPVHRGWPGPPGPHQRHHLPPGEDHHPDSPRPSLESHRPGGDRGHDSEGPGGK